MSLNCQYYQNNPIFLNYINKSGLPFKCCEDFNKKAINERTVLYQKMLEEIYNINIFNKATER